MILNISTSNKLRRLGVMIEQLYELFCQPESVRADLVETMISSAEVPACGRDSFVWGWMLDNPWV